MLLKQAFSDVLKRGLIMLLYLLWALCLEGMQYPLKVIPRDLGRAYIARIRYALILLGEDIEA